MQDRLWKKYGVEKDDYNYAIMKHQLNSDPDVLKMLDEVNEQYPIELRKKIVAGLQQGQGNEMDYQDYDDPEFKNVPQNVELDEINHDENLSSRNDGTQVTN